MSKVAVSMIGARMHYAVPRLLHELELLDRLYTDSYLGNKPWLEKTLRCIPTSLQPRGLQRWLGRCDSCLPGEKVISFETLGWKYVWDRYRAGGVERRELVHSTMAERFNNCIIDAGPTAQILWGFNGASLELFQFVKERGALCILEQTILPRQLEISLLKEEMKRWPSWEPGLDVYESNSPIAVREQQEWELADCIVAGSEFVRAGLIECGVPANKIRVVPYGVETNNFDCKTTKTYSSISGPLKILFAGIVGLRKGVPDLLKAIKPFSPEEVEVKIAGLVTLDRKKMQTCNSAVQILGHVPRSEMKSLYQWADVFVLPSIVEGSATVTYEALLSGVPVITTPNSGSIVQHGINGFIIPIRDPVALKSVIAEYRNDRELLVRHKLAALQSRQDASLNRYRNDLELVISELIT